MSPLPATRCDSSLRAPVGGSESVEARASSLEGARDLPELAFRLDRWGDDHVDRVHLADIRRATDAHAGTQGAHQVLRPVGARGRTEQQLLERGIHANLDP